MDDPKNPVELMPHEWASEREKPKEPFWGPGLPFFVCFMISVVIAALLHDYGWVAQVSASLLGALLAGIAEAIYGRSA